YYLTVAYGDLDNTYNVRVGRSRSITGPYVDYNGVEMNNSTVVSSNNNDIGTKITSPYNFENDSGWYSLAHSTFIVSEGTGPEGTDEYLLASNSRAGNVSGTRLNIRKIYWTEDGWPLVSPELYSGLNNKEYLQDIPTADIAGAYQVVELMRDDVPIIGTDNASVRRAAKSIFLNTDKTVSGEYTGKWTQTTGSAIKIQLNDTIYTAKIVPSWDWELWKPTLSITGISRSGSGVHDGVAIWGKRMDVETILDASVNSLTLQSTVRSDIYLPIALYKQVSIVWTSSNPDLVSNNGTIVSRPNADTQVTLTANLSIWGQTVTKEFIVTVKPDTVVKVDAPLAYYSFNNSAVWQDASEAGSALTPGGTTAAYTKDGVYKGGVLLSGSNQNGGYLTIPKTLVTAEDFTFSGWVYRTGSNANETIFSVGDATNYMSLNASNLVFTIKNES
ncbi:MAG: immunoglobulin-like domain-containing protein, partial [Ruminiclostridium sp.]